MGAAFAIWGGKNKDVLLLFVVVAEAAVEASTATVAAGLSLPGGDMMGQSLVAAADLVMELSCHGTGGV